VAEFASDTILHTTNQAGNYDTMMDLINDSIAAVVMAVAGMLYAQRHMKSKEIG
jgi:hypothetical protein